jgi:hypothetical protein
MPQLKHYSIFTDTALNSAKDSHAISTPQQLPVVGHCGQFPNFSLRRSSLFQLCNYYQPLMPSPPSNTMVNRVTGSSLNLKLIFGYFTVVLFYWG